MKNYCKVIATVTALLLAAGCATQIGTESQFGDAVRAVTTAQIHDMGAAQYPAADAVTGGHPDRIENVIKAHAEQAAGDDDVADPIEFGSER